MNQGKKTEIRGVCFDLDGTLVDTEPTAAAVLRRTLEDSGMVLPQGEENVILGRTLRAALLDLASRFDFEFDPEEIHSQVKSGYLEAVSQGVQVISGAKESLRSISACFPTVLVTGSHRSEAEAILGGLGVLGCFKATFTEEDYERSKPEPDSYQKALDFLGLSQSEVLVFEDSDAGVSAARAAGLWVVAVGEDHSRAHGFVPHLEEVDASWVREFEPRQLMS